MSDPRSTRPVCVLVDAGDLASLNRATAHPVRGCGARLWLAHDGLSGCWLDPSAGAATAHSTAAEALETVPPGALLMIWGGSDAGSTIRHARPDLSVIALASWLELIEQEPVGLARAVAEDIVAPAMLTPGTPVDLARFLGWMLELASFVLSVAGALALFDAHGEGARYLSPDLLDPAAIVAAEAGRQAPPDITTA